MKIYPKGYYPFNMGFFNNIKAIFFHKNEIRLTKKINFIDLMKNKKKMEFAKCFGCEDPNEKSI